MLGILKERLGLNKAASHSYKRALALAPNENNYRDMSRVNYGRSLTKLGNHREAIEVFTQVKAATFNSGSGLALALFKGNLFLEKQAVFIIFF